MGAEEMIDSSRHAEFFLFGDVLCCLLEVVLTRAEEGLLDAGDRCGVRCYLNGLELQEDDSTKTPILEGYVVEVLRI
jgi:hypothetical protein